MMPLQYKVLAEAYISTYYYITHITGLRNYLISMHIAF